MKKFSKGKVLELISQELRKVPKIHLGKIKLSVAPGDIQNRDGTWYVPVRPSDAPPSMFQYYEALAEVETELSEKHDLYVYLVPTLPA